MLTPKKRDSRSRAETSYRYYVNGTRLTTVIKRLRSVGDISYVRINRGDWIPQDRLPRDLRLRRDLVLDLVLARRKI